MRKRVYLCDYLTSAESALTAKLHQLGTLASDLHCLNYPLKFLPL